MRVIGEIVRPDCRITMFHWNNRYLIKVERDQFEQTFKIPEWDLTSEAELKEILSDRFIQETLERFSSMQASLTSALGGTGTNQAGTGL